MTRTYGSLPQSSVGTTCFVATDFNPLKKIKSVMNEFRRNGTLDFKRQLYI